MNQNYLNVLFQDEEAKGISSPEKREQERAQVQPAALLARKMSAHAILGQVGEVWHSFHQLYACLFWASPLDIRCS